MFKDFIYAMSSRECLKWDYFRWIFSELFQSMYPPDAVENEGEIFLNKARFQFIRTMESLGYCEFDFKNRIIRMCKPHLVLLPIAGHPQAILTGARSPNLIKKIKNSVKNNSKKALFHQNPNPTESGMPPRIHIEAEDADTLQKIAEETNISCNADRPVAWDLINFSVSIEEIKKSLKFEERSEPNWRKRIFINDNLRFSSGDECYERNYSLVEYKNPVDHQPRHWVWLDKQAAEITRDWGRYLSLAEGGAHVLAYDQKSNKLAIPYTVPLPCILARGVALCTGLAPVMASINFDKSMSKRNGLFRIYSGVPSFIIKVLSAKLGQKLNSVEFESNQQGAFYARPDRLVQ